MTSSLRLAYSIGLILSFMAPHVDASVGRVRRGHANSVGRSHHQRRMVGGAANADPASDRDDDDPFSIRCVFDPDFTLSSTVSATGLPEFSSINYGDPPTGSETGVLCALDGFCAGTFCDMQVTVGDKGAFVMAGVVTSPLTTLQNLSVTGSTGIGPFLCDDHSTVTIQQLSDGGVLEIIANFNIGQGDGQIPIPTSPPN